MPNNGTQPPRRRDISSQYGNYAGAARTIRPRPINMEERMSVVYLNRDRQPGEVGLFVFVCCGNLLLAVKTVCLLHCQTACACLLPIMHQTTRIHCMMHTHSCSLVHHAHVCAKHTQTRTLLTNTQIQTQDDLEPALVEYLRSQEEEHERFRALFKTDRSKVRGCVCFRCLFCFSRGCFSAAADGRVAH